MGKTPIDSLCLNYTNQMAEDSGNVRVSSVALAVHSTPLLAKRYDWGGFENQRMYDPIGVTANLQLTTNPDGTFNNLDTIQDIHVTSSPTFIGITLGTLNIIGGQITDTTGDISFGNETLTTSGDLQIDSDVNGVIFGDLQSSIIYDDGSDLIFDCDLNTIGGRDFIFQNGSIYFSAGEALAIADGEFAFFSINFPNAGLIFDATNTMYIFSNGTLEHMLEIRVTANGGELYLFPNDDLGMTLMGFGNNDAPIIDLLRYDNTPGVGNTLGILNFGDTTNHFNKLIFCAIEGQVAKAVGGAGDLPGDLLFKNCADGSNVLITNMKVAEDGGIYDYNLKSGATQVAAGAAANERWVTNGHATLPDNVVMIGV